MRITNQGIDLIKTEENRIKANKGYDKCPNCGRYTNKYFTHTSIKHECNFIEQPIEEKLIRVDKYYCYDCKIDWQSETYEVVKSK